MPDSDRCLSATELEQFVHHVLPSEAVDELARHLEVCERCSEVVDQMLTRDPVAQAMRGQTTMTETGPMPLMADLFTRVRALHPGGTASSQATDQPEKVTDQLAGAVPTLLAPPQAEGELGRLGGYRVLKVLGAGGMGVVFRAVDPYLDRTVALKTVHPALLDSRSAKKRFLREAKAAASLRHESIIAIYQVGEDRGIPYMAMEYLEGESLNRRLKREGRLPVGDVLRIAREIGRALAVVHGKGLVHRDVKPENIWLETWAPVDYRVKLLDFGLARSAEDQNTLTQAGVVLGTPAFMAPEQALKGAVDHRCDLFSLGCVLYYMCTGQVPFPGSDPVKVVVAASTMNPVPPIRIRPELPQSLSSLVMKLLAKNPSRRSQSIQEVLAELENVPSEPAAASSSGEEGPSVSAPGAVAPEPAAPSPTISQPSIAAKAKSAGPPARADHPAPVAPPEVAPSPLTYQGHGLTFQHLPSWKLRETPLDPQQTSWRIHLVSPLGWVFVDLYGHKWSDVVNQYQARMRTNPAYQNIQLSRVTRSVAGRPALGFGYQLWADQLSYCGKVLAVFIHGKTLVLSWQAAEMLLPPLEKDLETLLQTLAIE